MFKRTIESPIVEWEELRDINRQFLELPKCSCFNYEFCEKKLEMLICKLKKYKLLRQGYNPVIHGFYIYQKIYSSKIFSHKPEKCDIAFIYMICASILLAEKFNTDIPFKNKYWAKSLGVKLLYLNRMETLLLLSGIKLHVGFDELLEKIENND